MANRDSISLTHESKGSSSVFLVAESGIQILNELAEMKVELRVV